MRTHRPSLSPLPLALAVAAALAAAAAHADSGIGVDTWRANKLDPTGGMAAQTPDPDGTSWLHPGQSRSPTGNLYNEPPGSPHPDEHGDWQYYGVLQLGYLGTGDERAALWNRYADWKNDEPILGLLDLEFLRPSDGSYAALRGSRISDDDEYYQFMYGRAGAYKVQAFLRDLPNTLSTNARVLWNGAGSGRLTLPDGLVAGAGTPAEVAAASAARPLSALGVRREKQGLGYSVYLAPQWTAYFDATHEQRKGTRPYGGSFGENWDGNVGAILETVKPVDDSTINLNTGLRYAGGTWRLDVGYSGSFYRDARIGYSFGQPFLVPSSAGGGPPNVGVPMTQGKMSTEPDNDYHNLHLTLTRVLPMNGEASLNLSEVLMRQDDRLMPPTDCQGVFGYGIPGGGRTVPGLPDLGPQNPGLYPCSEWNTAAALSQPTADVSLHNTLAEGTLALRPTDALSLDAGLKYYRQKYDNDYVAYNPLNGYYGYLAENFAFISTTGTPFAIFNPGTYVAGSRFIDGRVLPFLLSMDEYEAHGGATWRFSGRDTLGLVYTFDRYEPTHRERQRVDTNGIKLTWVEKTLDWLTLRANYTFLRQTGDTYDGEASGYAFLDSLPEFRRLFPDYQPTPETVAALRKYDIGDRNEHKIDLMATLAPREDMTITASVRGDWNVYPAEIGRQGYDTLGATLAWDWQPAPSSSLGAYLGYDRSSLHMADVAGAFPSSAAAGAGLGGANYPLANRWWMADRERNLSAGASFVQRFARLTLDLDWNYLYSRGTTSYVAASPGALVFPEDYPIIGDGFAPMVYRVNSLTVGITVPINPRISLRMFDNVEIGRIDDWHYAGFDQSLVSGTTLYTDGGPQSYRANLVGLLVNIRL